jgi:predicted DNA-binding transcriptional regulator YafY
MVEHNKIHTLVYDVIKRYASEENPIDQNDILRKLLDNPDNACERKTVSRALERLRVMYGKDEEGNWLNEDIKLHYDVVTRNTSPIYKRYWLEICKDEGFTDEELMFLMVAVQFSKHVENGFAEEIVQKLTNLSNNKYTGVFEFHTKVNAKNIPIRKDFFLTLGDINEAIRHRTMISFFVNDYGTDKKLHRVGDRPLEVKPYRIVVSDGYFYLLCSEKDSSVIKNIRIDKITEVKETDEAFRYTKEQEKALFYPNEYLVEHRYMNNGESVKVVLQIERSILGEVIDSFGDKITISSDRETSNRLTVHLKSSERDIIDWAMRYGEYAVVVEPEYLRQEIISRANHLVRSYIDEEDTEIYYLELIERAREFGRLFLRNIDLNDYDSYKNMPDVIRASFNHNGIADFSFLQSYSSLKELSISRNEISDPDVISGLSNLRGLDLSMTGITDLDFLNGMDNLTRLSLHEYSIENVEALYSLPNLKFLTVNKPVSRLIDKQRLKRTYGSDFIYNESDHMEYSPLFMNNLPPKEPLTMRRFFENDFEFSTCELRDLSARKELSTRIYTGTDRILALNKDFHIYSACDSNERLNLYKDFDSYTGSEYSWFVTYEGTSEEPDLNRIYAISIFKRDHGLKLVCMARKRLRKSDFPEDSVVRLRDRNYFVEKKHIRYILDNNIGWAELDEHLENSFRRVSTIDNVINPTLLIDNKVIDNITVDSDDYHYCRLNDKGKTVKKIAYGHIEI